MEGKKKDKDNWTKGGQRQERHLDIKERLLIILLLLVSERIMGVGSTCLLDNDAPCVGVSESINDKMLNTRSVSSRFTSEKR